MRITALILGSVLALIVGTAAAAETCGPATDQLHFEGTSNGFVSEPFVLLEGTVIFSATIPAAKEFSYYSVEIQPAPRSAGEVGLNVQYGTGPYDGAATATVTTPGTFVLVLEASGPWSAAVEF